MQVIGLAYQIWNDWPKSVFPRLILGLVSLGSFLGPTAFSVIGGEPVLLPVEVAGDNGETATVAVDVAASRAGEVNSFWIQIHGLEYADMASVQVNCSEWVSLNNHSVVVAEPARSYGGIGGGFATLTMTLPLAPGIVVGGSNYIRFRFNHTDGVVTGFRVLAFNFVSKDGGMVCPSSTFAQEDPDTWESPLNDAGNIAAGKALWRAAPLTSSSLPGAGKIQAHCSDCHARDGRDLKYFNFSNRSIIARSRFHGLSLLEGRQIASYIRSLKTPNPGRPWNPPYQPGPGLDDRPVTDWAAGAGLEFVLNRDEETLSYIFSQGGQTKNEGMPLSKAGDIGIRELAGQITPAAFAPDANLNPREIPISFQLPDWNHWLPRVHPIDAWGSKFSHSDFARIYQGRDGEEDDGGLDSECLRGALASLSTVKQPGDREIIQLFKEWSVSRQKLLKKPLAAQSVQASPELTAEIYSTQLWQLVKSWELAQEFNLEYGDGESPGAEGPSRRWLNTIPEETAPATTGIPDGPNGMGGSALVNEYFDNAWYELQLLLNNGNHRHTDQRPIDWVYFMGRFLDLEKVSSRPEPGRAMVSIIKALQSTDPEIGPQNQQQGWRPMQNVSPTIMVSQSWQPVFTELPFEVRKNISEAMLEAWLDKNAQYPAAQYFIPGRVERTYKAPVRLGAITGERAWDASSQFQEAGVRPGLIRRLVNWGDEYSDTAVRFSY